MHGGCRTHGDARCEVRSRLALALNIGIVAQDCIRKKEKARQVGANTAWLREKNSKRQGSRYLQQYTARRAADICENTAKCTMTRRARLSSADAVQCAQTYLCLKRRMADNKLVAEDPQAPEIDLQPSVHSRSEHGRCRELYLASAHKRARLIESKHFARHCTLAAKTDACSLHTTHTKCTPCRRAPAPQSFPAGGSPECRRAWCACVWVADR